MPKGKASERVVAAPSKKTTASSNPAPHRSSSTSESSSRASSASVQSFKVHSAREGASRAAQDEPDVVVSSSTSSTTKVSQTAATQKSRTPREANSPAFSILPKQTKQEVEVPKKRIATADVPEKRKVEQTEREDREEKNKKYQKKPTRNRHAAAQECASASAATTTKPDHKQEQDRTKIVKPTHANSHPPPQQTRTERTDKSNKKHVNKSRSPPAASKSFVEPTTAATANKLVVAKRQKNSTESGTVSKSTNASSSKETKTLLGPHLKRALIAGSYIVAYAAGFVTAYLRGKRQRAAPLTITAR